ncbi:RHS repeat-associated core domain protein [Anoxybacillus sp. B7M1]|nr:RHS repeat-associated core domain protein [Anoxybacillus sp. B2M1]ANB65143.1 RHS repeat-associated core domain protein [Anoxybacillus sp. B7M1]
MIARYYHPTHGVFLSMDPDPGDSDDILTQNGYTYANNNPVMLVDPDGHFVWMAINAGFAAYDGYKAFKKGGWKAAAIAVGVGLVGGAAFKGAKIAYRAYKAKKATKFLAYIGQKSKYINITKGKSVYNRGTDVKVLSFVRNLRKSGWGYRRIKSQNQDVLLFEKDGTKYALRKFAKSHRGWTADYIPKGHKRAALKIRLGDD